jgi:DNA-binding transcriptional ArsR family regulator
MIEGERQRRGRRDFEKTRAEVLSHPLRVRMLEIANERDISAVGFVRGGYAAGLLEHLDERDAISHVSYHLHRLEKRACVELIDQSMRHGSIESLYRGTARAYFTNEEWRSFDKDRRRELTGVVLQGLMARAESAVIEDTFDSRDDRWLVWVQMDADDESWGELSTLCQEMMDKVEALRRAGEERLGKATETIETSPITFGMLSFESPAQI